MLDDGEPIEIREFQAAQAGRIREFLQRLGRDDDLLLYYIKDRVDVLRREVEAGALQNEDVALLLDTDYYHVSEVMSQGSAATRWIVIWIV